MNKALDVAVLTHTGSSAPLIQTPRLDALCVAQSLGTKLYPWQEEILSGLSHKMSSPFTMTQAPRERGR